MFLEFMDLSRWQHCVLAVSCVFTIGFMFEQRLQIVKMGKLCGIDFSVFMNCTVIWLVIYGFFIVVVEVVNLYVTIFLLLISVFTYILLCHLAIPQPTPNIVNEVLGSDPRAVKQKDLETRNTNDNNQQEESENICKVYAHRGAGLDAPENSIAAFRKVGYRN